MGFPLPSDRTATPFATAAASHLVAMPAAVSANRLLVMLFANSSSITPDTPSGWTQLGTANDGTGVRLTAFAKKAVGNEGGTTVDVVTPNSAQTAGALVYQISSWRDSGVLTDDVKIALYATGWTTAPNPPALNVPWGVEDALWLAIDGRNASVTVSAYPSAYGNGAGTISGEARISGAERELAASAEDPGVYTLSGAANNVCATVAIRPAVAGGGGTASDLTLLFDAPFGHANNPTFAVFGSEDGAITVESSFVDGADQAMVGNILKTAYLPANDTSVVATVNPTGKKLMGIAVELKAVVGGPTGSPPAAPSGLGLTIAQLVGPTKLDCSWVNNAIGANGNRVYISKNGANFVQMADVGPTVTSYQYVDATGAIGDYYLLRVVVYATGGEGAAQTESPVTIGDPADPGGPSPAPQWRSVPTFGTASYSASPSFRSGSFGR